MQETSLLSEQLLAHFYGFCSMQFVGYSTIMLLRLPTYIVRYKGQTNVGGGQLETQKDTMAVELPLKTNRRHGTISNPPEEEEADKSA